MRGCEVAISVEGDGTAMPVYEYECQKCGTVFEVTQSFRDDPLTRCQDTSCRGKVKKLFSPPAIIFKGSGFHVTDYGRGNGKSSKPPKPEGDGSEPCKSCDGSSCSKED